MGLFGDHGRPFEQVRALGAPADVAISPCVRAHGELASSAHYLGYDMSKLEVPMRVPFPTSVANSDGKQQSFFSMTRVLGVKYWRCDGSGTVSLDASRGYREGSELCTRIFGRVQPQCATPSLCTDPHRILFCWYAYNLQWTTPYRPVLRILPWEQPFGTFWRQGTRFRTTSSALKLILYEQSFWGLFCNQGSRIEQLRDFGVPAGVVFSKCCRAGGEHASIVPTPIFKPSKVRLLGYHNWRA